jgi:hypothetical protein
MSFFILLIFSHSLNAAEIQLGTFSLATEAGWTAWFHLEKNNKITISPSYDTEDFDPAVKNAPKPSQIFGTWKQTSDGIEITYSKITDTFKFEDRCQEWQIHPCFRFVKTSAKGSQKSVLNYPQSYVNWSWKLDPPKELPTKDFEKCKSDCEELTTKNQLKKGVTKEICIKEMCKPSPPPEGYH